jgi:hypothetical protein
MDEETLESILRDLVKMFTSLDSDILDLKTSVAVLKLRLARLAGEDDPKAALDSFRADESRVRDSLPLSKQLKEARDVLNVLEKHGKTFGKNQA